jgi:trk system potassium uptake protein TrkH
LTVVPNHPIAGGKVATGAIPRIRHMRNRFETFHVVMHFIGSLLLVLSAFLLLPLIIVLICREIALGWTTVIAFVVPSAIALVTGLLLRLLCRRGNPDSVQAMLVCSLGWLGFSAIGALPFVLGIGSSYLDGYFETMSGFTTTGITMFTGLDMMPKSIIFWRSLTQWIGGLGILTFFLAVTYKGGSAHMLFGAESHKISVDRPVPGLGNTVKILWGIYSAFTLVIAAALVAAGMPLFEGLCHSFTALSTGGYSPFDASIAHYKLNGFAHYRLIEYILIVGMLLGGTNFLVHYRLSKREWRALWDNTEMRYWWGFIGAFIAAIAVERFMRSPMSIAPGSPGFWGAIEENIRSVAFQVVSIITTTGFGTRDIGSPYFGFVAKQLFLVMMVIGGCVGSTGGGIKILRVSVLAKLVRREIFRLRTPPQSVSTVVVDGKPVHTNEVYRISGMFFTWIVLLIIGGLVTAFLSNLDSYSAFSGMFSALGNIGPCYIPTGQMGQLHPAIKMVYIFGMLAGRLEILPVLLIFSSKVWKH